jgi:predicted Zn-dependent protease
LIRPPATLSLVLIGWLWATGCAGPEKRAEAGPEPEAFPALYHPDRRDYAAFREAHPGLLEPNYLPFMAHRIPGDAVRGDALVFCRWSPEQMPIRVFIDAEPIPSDLQDEFRPHALADYVAAVAEALATWQRELDGLVSFERVEQAERATLRLRLRAVQAPVPETGRRVLGMTPALSHACLAGGWDPDAERLRVRFELAELDIYLADEFGLLTSAQVARVALHELGHALGMRGHSPSPGDLMYAVLGDAPGQEGLSDQDVHSFVSLYRVPNGEHLAQVPPGPPAPRPPPAPPSGAPSLSLAPWVDARFGYEIRMPAGWLHIEEAHGVFAANGPTWDYDASLRIFVWPYPTLEAFLQRFSHEIFADTWLVHRAPVVVLGRRSLEVEVEAETETQGGDVARQLLFVELGDGRVMMLASEMPVAFRQAWQPWLGACIASLEIWDKVGPSGAMAPSLGPRISEPRP